MNTIIAVAGIIIAVAILSVFLTGCTGLKREYTVGTGKDIKPDDITEFYYTLSSSTNPPDYQRYYFHIDGDKKLFYHEKREGDHWPLLESDATITGTIELSEEEWNEFLSFIDGGTVKAREENAKAGGSGPWLYLYWNGDKGKIQQFKFKSYAEQSAFEAFCASFVD